MNIILDVKNLNHKDKAPVSLDLVSKVLSFLLSQCQEKELLKPNYYDLGNNNFFDFKLDDFSYNRLDESDLHYVNMWFTQERDPYENVLQFIVREDYLACSLILEVNIEELNNHVRLLSDLANGLFTISREYFTMGPIFTISVDEFDYARLRPLRKWEYLNSHGLVNFFDLKYYENLRTEFYIDGITKLLNNEDLPTYVGYNMESNLAMVHWFHGIDDYQAFENRLMDREDWIYQHLELPLDPDFSVEGDKLLWPLSTIEKSPAGEDYFPYYQQEIGLAYKPYVLDASGKIDQETLNVVAKYLERGTLDSGDRLDRIVFVMASREHAIKIIEQALSIGIYKVVYVDEERNIWDMNPIGNWRN